MSKTRHPEPTPRQRKRELKRRQQWQAMQPPPLDYPLPPAPVWKVEG